VDPLAPDPLIGSVLDGRYRVVGVVGTGGMGKVYRAEQTTVLGRPVAIKLLAGDLGWMSQTVAERFENEARIIAQLRHPNTLKLLDSGRLEDGRLFIVTELLEGETLDEALKQSALSEMRTVRIVRQICASLSEAHEHGVIHRDLKPGNIFLERVAGQEIVKVLDFGVAKLINFPGPTAPMQVCGTPGFMAPEQIRGLKLDHRTDIYAIGVIAYHCLTGRPPFSAESAIVLLRKHLEEMPRPLGEVIAVDRELERIVMRMLEKRPEARPATAREAHDVFVRIEAAFTAAGRDREPDVAPVRKAIEEKPAAEREPSILFPSQEIRAAIEHPTEPAQPPLRDTLPSAPAWQSPDPMRQAQQIELRPMPEPAATNTWRYVAIVLGVLAAIAFFLLSRS
jgi:eukaryotic-like serine/threonine-protein kinase